MVHLIETVDQIPALVNASRAIALLSVPWSVWPRKSKKVLELLEKTQTTWASDLRIEYFDIWPEKNEELNRWYEGLCEEYADQFELHGHGYGPLWWVRDGVILRSMTKPYELDFGEVKRLSAFLLAGKL